MGSMSVVTVFVWIAYVFTLYFLVYWLLFFLEKQPQMKEEYAEKVHLKIFPMASVLVPAYNEEKTVEKTLQSLIELDWPKDKLEIIVINDGSKDKTSAIVKAFMKKHPKEPIQLIEQHNQGKAVAMNNGLKILKGEYFTCLDADSWVHPKALQHMIHWHQKDKNIAITTPVMKIARPTTWVQKFQRLEYMTGMLLTRLMSYMDANYVAPGPFSTYKTKIIRDLGGFDVNNLVEDQEIAYRVQEHHYKIVQAPHAIVETVGPHTIKGLSKQRNRWFKGTILNLFKYKHLMFRRKYGDFGMFQLPIINVMAFVLGIIAMLGFVWYTIRPLFKQFYNYWLIRFDFLPYLKSIQWTFDPLNIQITPIFILYSSLALTLVFLYISSRVNNDRVRAYGFWYIIPYFFVYFIIMSYVVVRVIFEIIIGKKQKW